MKALRILAFVVLLIHSARGQSATSAVHPTVLHAARLLDVETGRMLRPGEILTAAGKIAAVALW
jgi:hypothetical protein